MIRLSQAKTTGVEFRRLQHECALEGLTLALLFLKRFLTASKI